MEIRNELVSTSPGFIKHPRRFKEPNPSLIIQDFDKPHANSIQINPKYFTQGLKRKFPRLRELGDDSDNHVGNSSGNSQVPRTFSVQYLAV